MVLRAIERLGRCFILPHEMIKQDGCESPRVPPVQGIQHLLARGNDGGAARLPFLSGAGLSPQAGRVLSEPQAARSKAGRVAAARAAKMRCCGAETAAVRGAIARR